MTKSPPQAVNPQAEHYRNIHDEYVRAYFDGPSMQYRNEFVYDHVFDKTDFSGLTVADIASSSGYNSLELLKRFPSAKTIGIDISESACADYRKLTGQTAICTDLTTGAYDGPQADAAMVFGGLHHCVTDLGATFGTIAKIVRPGGVFFMFEPNNRYLLEGARKFWYKASRYFEEQTEGALDHNQIAETAQNWFEPEDVVFRGGPAYFLIYNSLLFGISEKTKQRLGPALFATERAYNLLPGRLWYPYFIARWRRRG